MANKRIEKKRNKQIFPKWFPCNCSKEHQKYMFEDLNALIEDCTSVCFPCNIEFCDECFKGACPKCGKQGCY